MVTYRATKTVEHDLFSEMVITVYDQIRGSRIYDQLFWSYAASHWHVRSYVANPTWQYCDQMRRSLIRISPAQIGVLYGPSPTIQPIYIFFLPILISYMGLFYHLWLFIFGPWPFWTKNYSSSSPMGPSCQVGPSCQGHFLQFTIF